MELRLKRVLWTRDQLIEVLKLYCQLPFSKIDQRNPVIVKLASTLGRTPGAVALKMANFANLDPTLQQNGMPNASSLDREVWKDFFENLDTFVANDSEIEELEPQPNSFEEPVQSFVFDEWDGPTERTRWVRTRASQLFFRRMILASYSSVCSITGI
jgi:putative restriction endonuclease